MRNLNRTVLILAALAMLQGCSSRRAQQQGFADRPQWKGEKTSSRASRRGEKAAPPPRILPETHYAAGRVFEQQGAPAKAIEQYRKAVAVNHEYTDAYARLGLMYSITGRHEEAIAAFTRAVELKPNSPILRNNLGFELLYVERWDEAERHLREATRLDAKLAKAHVNLGLLLARTQRDEEAIQSFGKVLPKPDAYYNLGLVQRAQRRYERSAETFRNVLSINPNFIAAQRQLNFVESKIAAVSEPSPEAVAEAVPFEKVSPVLDLTGLISGLFGTARATDSIAPVEPVEAAAPPAPAEEFVEAPTPSTVEFFEEESISPSSPVTPPVMQAAAATRPLQWDTNLHDLAAALNEMDSQSRGLCQLRGLVSPPGPVAAQWSAFDEMAGPPAPLMEDTMLVLGTSESRTENIKAKLTPVSHRTLAFEQSWELSREVEASIEIARNEIECRREQEVPDSRSDAFSPQGDTPAVALQPTEAWGPDFVTLDHTLAIVRNETECTQSEHVPLMTLETTLVESPTETPGTYQYGPVLATPPVEEPSKNRSESKKSKKSERSRKRRR